MNIELDLILFFIAYFPFFCNIDVIFEVLEI